MRSFSFGYLAQNAGPARVRLARGDDVIYISGLDFAAPGPQQAVDRHLSAALRVFGFHSSRVSNISRFEAQLGPAESRTATFMLPHCSLEACPRRDSCGTRAPTR